MLNSHQSQTHRMNLRAAYFLVALLLAACSSAPTQQNKTEQAIVNQADDPATEARFSQNLNELLTQVSQSQEIPLQNIPCLSL